MHHRYGRHGPRAWKRLQESKYVHRRPELPVPVVPTSMIVRITVPTTTERVIVILMPENPQSNETQQAASQELQIITSHAEVQPSRATNALVHQEDEAEHLSTEDVLLINNAQWKALSDAKTVKRLTSNGKFVRLHRPRMEERIETFVDRYFENIITNGGPTPSVQEYQNQAKRYRNAYLTRFNEEIGGEQGRVNLLSSPLEARLRELAIQDRNRFPSPWRRPFHQRDLAVIQILLELDISLDRAREELETIHDHADIYEKYYANPREEVTWPSPDSF